MPVFQPEVIGAGVALRRVGRLRLGAAALCLMLLSGCEVLLAPLNERLCYGCTWIVQEWDSQGWNTHNSDPFDTEELCEQELEKQTRESPDRGHRCINKGDRDALQATQQAQTFCYRCNWVVEIAEYQSWERIEPATYHTEGACQQVLWHQSKLNPGRDFRCVKLGR